jgi:hypothetical protein
VRQLPPEATTWLRCVAAFPTRTIITALPVRKSWRRGRHEFLKSRRPAINRSPFAASGLSGPGAWSLIVAKQNWHPIAEAPKGAGPLLLRSGPGTLDPAFVGYQDPDNGRWFCGAPDNEVHPTFFCKIPDFDADDEGAAA